MLGSEDMLSSTFGTPDGPTEVRILVIAGQSNASGRAELEAGDDQPVAGITMTDASNERVAAVHPMHFDSVDAGYGFGRAAARAIRARLGGDVMIVPCAVGGSFISSWKDGQANFEAAITRIEAAIALLGDALVGDDSAVLGLWHQGEAELAGKAEATHAADIDEVIADFRTALSRPNMPFVLGEIRAGASVTNVNAAINDTPNRVANTAVVADPNLEPLTDAFHFGHADLKAFGDGTGTGVTVGGYAQATLRILGEELPNAPTPSLAAGDEQLTVTWTNDVDADSYNIEHRPTAGGSWTTLTGQTSGAVISGLTNDTSYDVRIVASNANGSRTSDAVSGTPQGNVASVQFVASSLHRVSVADATWFSGAGAAFSIYDRVSLDSLPSTNGVYTFASIFGNSTAEQALIVRLRDIGGATRYFETIVEDTDDDRISVRWDVTSIATVDNAWAWRWVIDTSQTGAANQVSLEINTGAGYVDQGAPTVDTDNGIAGIRSATAPFLWGMTGEFAAHLDGRQDELRIYSDPATEQVQELYLAGDNDFTDSSGNGRHGTGLPGGDEPTFGDPINV